MKIFVATVEITCGEFSATKNDIIVAEDYYEAQLKANELVISENNANRNVAFILTGVLELLNVDGYKLKYELTKIN